MGSPKEQAYHCVLPHPFAPLRYDYTFKKRRADSRLLSLITLNTYFFFSSIASRVWVAEVTIGVPGPKILAAPAARSSS